MSSSEENDDWTYQSARDLELNGNDRLCSELREVGLVGLAIHWIARLFSKAILRILLRIEVEGTEHIPRDAPFVVVANHSSHLDALVLEETLPARFLGRLFSIAAADYFFDKPGKTVFATRWVNALPVRRGPAAGKALGVLRDRLASGECIFIVFPEGTRSRDGRQNPFKPGIGMLVAATDVPVIPCHLDGAHEAWPPDRKFPRRGTVRVRYGKSLTFSQSRNGKEGWLEIAETLESEVTRLSGKVEPLTPGRGDPPAPPAPPEDPTP